MKPRSLVLPSLLAAIAFGPLHAQDAKPGDWNFLVEPYLMFPNMKGEVGVADLPPAPVDESPSDIFSHLQMGAMLYFEANNGRWMFSSDLLYMDLESDLEPNDIVTDGKAQMSQLGFELAAMRRLSQYFELGLSLVYNRIDADVNMTFDTVLGTNTRSVSMTEDWIDPTIVARATFPYGGKWFGQFRFNVGGFGVGSDLFWQIQADVVYRHSDKWDFSFGYRFMDFDYDQGSGLDRFAYGMQNFGPVFKAGYRF
jgi:hypothetical protein